MVGGVPVPSLVDRMHQIFCYDSVFGFVILALIVHFPPVGPLAVLELMGLEALSSLASSSVAVDDIVDPAGTVLNDHCIPRSCTL